MGDNVYLGDRDGVRTPMQWTGDRNGGFSPRGLRAALRAAADGPGLRLPGRQRRGAAAHADVAAALGAALHRAAQGAPGVRPGHATSRCAPANTRSSPTSASYEDDVVLCVHNVARSAQAVELDLSRLRGPPPGRDVRAHALPADRRAALPADARAARLLLVPAEGSPTSRSAAELREAGADELAEPALVRLEVPRLADVERARRPCAASTSRRCSAVVEVAFHAGTHELYQLPGCATARTSVIDEPTARRLDALARLDDRRAPTSRPAATRLVRVPSTGARVGDDRARSGRWAPSSRTRRWSSTSGSALKVYRRLGPGLNPELEMLRFLTERGFAHIAALRGWYDAHGPADRRHARRSLQEFVPGATDGWELALGRPARATPRASSSARRGSAR